MSAEPRSTYDRIMLGVRWCCPQRPIIGDPVPTGPNTFQVRVGAPETKIYNDQYPPSPLSLRSGPLFPGLGGFLDVCLAAEQPSQGPCATPAGVIIV